MASNRLDREDQAAYGRLSLEDFQRFLARRDTVIHIPGNYVIRPCACRQPGCLGWRLVAVSFNYPRPRPLEAHDA